MKVTMTHGQKVAKASVTGAILLVLSMVGAVAQPQRPQTSPPAATPSSTPPAAAPAQTTATYGDWTLRCVRLGEAANSPRNCEVVQSLAMRGQQQPFAHVAVGGAGKGEPPRFTIVVPLSVSFALAPQLKEGDTSLLALVWRRCAPTGCFADGQLSADLLQKLRARTEPFQLGYRDAADQDVVLAISPRGLAQSLDALAKEESQR
jgi:invasion protein IalB